MLTLLAALWTFQTASAADCDAKALAKEVAEASPAATAAAFTRLAACSPAEAKKLAPTAVPKFIATADAGPALVAAVRVGAPDPVRAWIHTQEPDNRTRAIQALGDACDTEPAIVPFFVDTKAKEPGPFWDERWHKALSECRQAPARQILEDLMAKPELQRNRAAFQSLLEVYSRNLGADAIEKLRGLLATAKDDADAITFISAFGDAVGLGSRAGANPEAVTSAKAALEAAAPKLGARSIDRMRGLFQAMGDDTAASRLARYAYPERFTNGVYVYGVAAIEDITCKNKEQRAALYYGSMTEPGQLWRDELAPKIEERLRRQWTLDAATKCKGTSTITFKVSDEPLSPEALEAWLKATFEDFDKTFGGRKTTVVAEDGFGF